MVELKPIPLVEDNPKDIKLTLAALERCGLAADVVVMLTSSWEERDLLTSYRRGVNAFVVKPVDFQAFFSVIRDLGMFWAVLNEPPLRESARL